MEKEIKIIKEELAKQKQKVFDLETKVNGMIDTIEIIYKLVNTVRKFLEKKEK